MPERERPLPRVLAAGDRRGRRARGGTPCAGAHRAAPAGRPSVRREQGRARSQRANGSRAVRHGGARGDRRRRGRTTAILRALPRAPAGGPAKTLRGAVVRACHVRHECGTVERRPSALDELADFRRGVGNRGTAGSSSASLEATFPILPGRLGRAPLASWGTRIGRPVVPRRFALKSRCFQVRDTYDGGGPSSRAAFPPPPGPRTREPRPASRPSAAVRDRGRVGSLRTRRTARESATRAVSRVGQETASRLRRPRRR